MNMSSYYIIGVRVDNRLVSVAKFQETLTKDGCSIKTRLGLHDVGENVCSADGIVIIQPYGAKDEVDKLVNELNDLEGITAKLIDLN